MEGNIYYNIWFFSFRFNFFQHAQAGVCGKDKRLSSFALRLVILSSKCNFLFDDDFLCLLLLTFFFLASFYKSAYFPFYIIHRKKHKHEKIKGKQESGRAREWENERKKLWHVSRERFYFSCLNSTSAVSVHLDLCDSFFMFLLIVRKT